MSENKIIITTGRRVYPDDSDGRLWLAEGDYGKTSSGEWQIRLPGCHAGGILYHTVEEHEDGTITVSPSIILHDFDPDFNPVTWHGYLERGVWREC